jgi:mono/diheme cytochrome c family protein
MDFQAGRETPLGGAKAGISPELDALAAYVTSLTQANPSPFRNPDGTLTADAIAGEALFHGPETRCAACHAPPRFTDSDLAPLEPGAGSGIKAMPGGFLLHDVGTLKPGSGKRLNDTLQGLDTPTLLGLWETGPYLHDGSAATVMDVLTTANAGDRHGKTSHLTARQLDQLAAYLLQLDQASAASGSGVFRGHAVRAPGRFSLRGEGRGYRILWNLPEASGRVRMRIFDVAGRLVAALSPTAGRPGEPLSFHWSGGDSGSPPAAPGVHLFRVDWDGGSRTQRAYMVPR